MIFTVLWVLLWIVIWLLVAVVGLALLVILLLCVPIWYRAEAKTGDETSAWIKARFLFGLVRTFFVYENGKERTDVWVLGFKVRGRKKKKRKKRKKQIKHLPSQGIEGQARNDSEGSRGERQDSVSQGKHPKENPPSHPEKKGVKEYFNKVKKIREVLTDTQLKTIMGLAFKELKRIFRVLLPKHIDVIAVVGLPDPADTGMLLGAVEALIGVFHLRRKTRLVRVGGEFDTDSTVVRIDAKVRGSVNLGRMAVPMLIFLLKKPVRGLIFDFLREDDDDE